LFNKPWKFGGSFILSTRSATGLDRQGDPDLCFSHLREMINVGLIDATWPARLPPPLADRLQQLLDNPNG
jgi:hypothetical protein